MALARTRAERSPRQKQGFNEEHRRTSEAARKLNKNEKNEERPTKRLSKHER